jgi:hypothetical protein
MDSQVLMVLAALGFFGWLIGACKRRAQVWTRLVGLIGAPWLAFYFFLVMLNAEPTLISGKAQAGYPTVFFMALGVIAVLAKPKPPKPDDTETGGGALSA